MNSIISGVKIDKEDAAPLHEQVAGEIRRAIASGEAKSGDRLPPAKDIASVLGVNANTVLRAFRALRDEGVLEFGRGRGVIVSASPDHARLVVMARELLEEARREGYRRSDVIRLIQSL